MNSAQTACRGETFGGWSQFPHEIFSQPKCALRVSCQFPPGPPRGLQILCPIANLANLAFSWRSHRLRISLRKWKKEMFGCLQTPANTKKCVHENASLTRIGVARRATAVQQARCPSAGYLYQHAGSVRLKFQSLG